MANEKKKKGWGANRHGNSEQIDVVGKGSRYVVGMWLVCCRYVVSKGGRYVADKGGRYVVDIWMVLYVVGMWSICGWYVVDMWLVCGWYVVGMWLVCGRYVVGM